MSDLEGRPVRESISEYSEMALPNDANPLGNQGRCADVEGSEHSWFSVISCHFQLLAFSIQLFYRTVPRIALVNCSNRPRNSSVIAWRQSQTSAKRRLRK